MGPARVDRTLLAKNFRCQLGRVDDNRRLTKNGQLDEVACGVIDREMVWPRDSILID
jgi:hypothetical protein